jgi:copper chaperone CopZ
MKNFLIACLMAAGLSASAQIRTATLQASGLTCSMCSKAVKNALDKVPFVEKVMVDIKSQQYNITFRNDVAIELDALGKAVEDAGFSVAQLSVVADVQDLKAEKDKHVRIGDAYFHFLNATGQSLNGSTRFTVVDKAFVAPKNQKKYTGMSKMACVKTGRASSCCTEEAVPAEARIYHVII